MNWPQLQTIFWLRWRLMRNQWTRSKGVGAVIAIIASVGAVIVSVALFAVGVVTGIVAFGSVPPIAVWGVWLGLTLLFLFLWMIGLLQELQRSESIDLQRLMHLPAALGQIFVVNYIASHLAISIILTVPAMLGLALGMAVSRGPSMLLLAPLALTMVFMVTSWTYCLRGWLAGLMSNPRRRRTIIMAITVGFILLAQAPNFYFNFLRHFGHETGNASGEKEPGKGKQNMAALRNDLNTFKAVEGFVPLFWLPVGAEALAKGGAAPALLGICGGAALGALGLLRAYGATLRFYRGDPCGKAAAPKPPPAPVGARGASAGPLFLEYRFPGVPEQAAALAAATLRSWLRAPEVKIAWGSSVLVPIIAGGSLLFSRGLKVPEAGKPFVATAAAAFTVFMLAQFFVNLFGFDRDGFRALVLCPAERRLIMLGKNLACLPVGAGFGAILLLVVSAALHLTAVMFLCGFLQLAALLLLAALVGNVISILVPYRIQPGTMKPTKMPGLAMVIVMLCHFLLPIAMAPAFLPPLAQLLWRRAGWTDAVPVDLILSAGLLAILLFAYWLALAPLGRLLQTNETKILAKVTVEVE